MLSKKEVLDICEDVSPIIVEKLKVKYPQYFNNVVIGRFYRFENLMFFYKTDDLHLYYINSLEYASTPQSIAFIKKNINYWTEIDDLFLMKEYLLMEAKRVGFKENVLYYDKNKHIKVFSNFNNLLLEKIDIYYYIKDTSTNGILFFNHSWAKIL